MEKGPILNSLLTELLRITVIVPRKPKVITEDLLY